MKGAQLKNEIKKRGYTVKMLADILGKSSQNISNQLSTDDVSSSIMETAAEMMGISVADFYRPDNSSQAGSAPVQAGVRVQAAMAAMQGMIVSGIPADSGRLSGLTAHQWVAKESVKYADSLTKELKQRPK